MPQYLLRNRHGNRCLCANGKTLLGCFNSTEGGAYANRQRTRHYHAGTITTRELARLDGIIMDRAFFLDNLNTNPTITAP